MGESVVARGSYLNKWCRYISAILTVVILDSSTLADPPDDPPNVSPDDMQEILKALEVPDGQPSTAQTPTQSSPVLSIGAFSLDLALILDIAGAWFSEKETLQTGGHDPARTGFTLQQLELSINAFIDPYFRLDTNIVFSEFGVEVEEAYATTLALPAKLQVRAGQMLTRFGRHNNRHPHGWSFVDQPIVIGKFFGSEGSRGLGVELSWLLPTPWYVESIATATLAGGECCARSFYGADDLGVDDPLDLVYTLALKQFFPLDSDWSLSFGLSVQLGPNPTGNGNRTEIFGSDLYLRYRPVGDPSRMSLSLAVEALVRSRQVPNDQLLDGGGVAQLIWQINPNWETAARVEWVTGVRNDPLDREWTQDRMRYSLQGTFYPSHFSRIRLQGSVDQPRWLDEPIWGAILGLELVAGSHGAHEF